MVEAVKGDGEGKRLGLELRPDEEVKLRQLLERGNKRQRLLAATILQWSEGYTIPASAESMKRAKSTIQRWRGDFRSYGFQIFHDVVSRTDLQALSARLLAEKSPVSTAQIQQLALAHLAQIMPDAKGSDPTRAKIVNECLGILVKCNSTKAPSTGGIEKAIAAAMGDTA